MENNSFDVFISHSSQNKQLANEICQMLEGHNFKCWIAPRNIRPGESYPKGIMNGITNSKMMVLVFTRDANDSGPVANEIENACNMKKVIIPFIAENVQMNDDLKYYLQRTHHLIAYPNPKEHFDELVNAISETLGLQKSKTLVSKSTPNVSTTVAKSTLSAPTFTPTPNNNQTTNTNTGSLFSVHGKKIGYIAVALIALIWIFAKPGHSDKSENQEEAAVEVVDDTPTSVEANVVGANNRTSTQRTQTPKATPSVNTPSESSYSQQPSTGNSSNAETSQSAAPTQSVSLSEPAATTPAAAPVELSASELLSKGRSAVKKFKAGEGAEYFKQSIAKGSVEANYYLGELYYSGNGVAKSFPTAKSYFQKAAQAGMADAQYMMGVMYRNGQGGDKNLDEAKSWLQKAASQGNANAERLLKQIN